MTAIVPYRPAVAAGSDGFAQLLHAEWTKFRTVRGWVAGLLVAGLLTIGITLLNHSQCGFSPNGTTVQSCPGVPIGPDGQAVTDSFYFVHQPAAGDGTITARVTSLTGLYRPGGGGMSAADPLAGYVAGVRPWAKTGIMIKASTVAGSAYVAMLVTGGNGVRMQYDYAGDIAGLPGAATTAAPRWLRLVRSGDSVAGYDSLDGAHWTRVGQVTLPGLPSAAQAGLFTASPSYAVYSGSVGSGSEQGGPTLATGTLDHLTTSWGSEARAGTTVGGTGPGGTPSGSGASPFNGGDKQAGGRLTVSGSGDIAPNVASGPDGAGSDPTQAMVSGTFFALIAMVIVGAMFITAEYRRGMIRTTLTASPRRGRVLAAKAVVLAGVTFTVGLIGTAIALPLGEAVLRNGGNWIPPVPALTTARIIVGTAAAMAVAAVLALAMGAIARRGVAAVSAVIVIVVLPFLFSILPGLLPAGAENWLLRIFPAAAFAVQQAFPAYHQVLAQYGPDNGYYPLAWWAGFLVLCAWAALAFAAATVLIQRRDA
jgi:ABC-type transport system involved in multi-copper enzyme maturation permease subunit